MIALSKMLLKLLAIIFNIYLTFFILSYFLICTLCFFFRNKSIKVKGNDLVSKLR